MSGGHGRHAIAPLLVNNNRLLLILSLFSLLDRERGTCFGSFVGGLATLEDAFGAIAVPAAGVAGSANEKISASGAAFDKEVRVVLGGIFKKLLKKRLQKIKCGTENTGDYKNRIKA